MAASKKLERKYVVRACDEAEFRDFCRGHIAHYKIPRHVRFVEEFPLTISGKVQKFVIRERMIRHLDRAAPSTA